MEAKQGAAMIEQQTIFFRSFHDSLLKVDLTGLTSSKAEKFTKHMAALDEALKECQALGNHSNVNTIKELADL